MMIFTGERCLFGLVPVEDGSTYGFAAWAETLRRSAGLPPGTAPAAVRGLRRAGPGLPRRPAARRPDPLRAGRMGRTELLALRPGGPDRRRRTRHPTAHGRRRGDGYRRCRCAGPATARRGHHRGRPRPVPGPAPATGPVGPAAEPPRRQSRGAAPRDPRRRAMQPRRPDAQGPLPATHPDPLAQPAPAGLAGLNLSTSCGGRGDRDQGSWPGRPAGPDGIRIRLPPDGPAAPAALGCHPACRPSDRAPADTAGRRDRALPVPRPPPRPHRSGPVRAGLPGPAAGHDQGADDGQLR